jgi:hypothetical protein
MASQELPVASTGWDATANAPVASVALVYDDVTLIASAVHAVNRSATETASVRIEDTERAIGHPQRVRTYPVPTSFDQTIAIDPMQLVWTTDTEVPYLTWPRYQVGMSGPDRTQQG